MRPMRLSQLVSSILWLVPLSLQAAIALAILCRRLLRVFPIFFSYTVLVPVRDIILLLLPFPGNRYSFVFWWGDAVVILLSLAIIFEVLWHLFRPYPFLHFVFRLVGIVAVVVIVCTLTLLRTGPIGADRILESILLMERSARVLQVGLLVALMLLMSRLGLTWQHYSLGIAAGFGIYSALDLILLELRGHLHFVNYAAFAFLGSGAYNLAVLVWAFYFLKSGAGTPVRSLPSTELANWNAALTEHVDKWYRH